MAESTPESADYWKDRHDRRKMRHLKKNNPKRHRVVILWRHDPHCHWCGVETVLERPEGSLRRNHNPENLATLDHIYSRFEPQRKTNKDAVLACHRCNNERSKWQSKRPCCPMAYAPVNKPMFPLEIPLGGFQPFVTIPRGVKPERLYASKS